MTAIMAAGCGCGSGRSARASARRNTRCGRSPTSPATASARKTDSRSCSTRSNMSTMRHASSSRSTPRPTWLGHDLAELGSGGLKLIDIVSGDGASLLTSIVAVPGEVKTEVFDIDLRMRGGKTMPARLYHKLAFGADGAPGASRTLVISRARDERSDPQRAAEVRFMRFFDHTPMAIATVARGGAVVRANARFAKLAQSLGLEASAANSIFRTVNARDRSSLIAAINQAAEGQGDIAPAEALLVGGT